MGKRLLLAAPRGYCAGVDRAVIAVEKALERYGAPVYVRKQIVHNIHVVRTLERAGAVFVDEVSDVPEGAHLVFSAHGVSPAVESAAAARGLLTIDATCPLVTKVHREAIRFAGQDRQIVLIGHAGHEEVEGTMGQAPTRTLLVQTPDEVDALVVDDPSRLVWLSQTTLSVDETMETVRRLRARFPEISDPPSDDICYATQNRQVAIKKVAAEADLVVVVGSRNSSNTMRPRRRLPRSRCRRGAPRRLRRRDRSRVARRGVDGRRDVGCERPRGARPRGDRLARRARIRRRRGGHDRDGGPALLAAEGAPHRERFAQPRRARPVRA